MHRAHLAVGLVATLALAACGGPDPAGGAGGSGAICPPGGTTLAYTGGGNGTTEPASFGATFFANYCLTCHGATPSGGAPPHASFDTLAGIQDHLPLIDQKAAAGPARTNTVMPPVGGPLPTVAERTLLGTWLACGAP